MNGIWNRNSKMEYLKGDFIYYSERKKTIGINDWVHCVRCESGFISDKKIVVCNDCYLILERYEQF